MASDEPALARYYELVADLHRHHGQALDVGRSLLDLAPTARGARLLHAEARALRPAPAAMAIVFAALAVARYLQAATGLSIKKVVRALRPLQQITVRLAGHEHTAADPLTHTAQDILRALNATPH